MATVTTHIRLDDQGVAWIDDTNIKVIEVVMDQRAHGWSPEEISFQHYGTLSLAQIHAALAFYHDHQSALDAVIERQAHAYEEQRANLSTVLVKSACVPTSRTEDDMASAAVQKILALIDDLPDPERALLDQELAARSEAEWKKEAKRARRLAKEKGIDQATIDEILQRRLFSS